MWRSRAMLYFLSHYFKDDIVTRGIMPLAIAIFNDNDHAIDVDGMSIHFQCLMLYRQDDGSRLVFFEISLNAALPAAGSRHGSSRLK